MMEFKANLFGIAIQNLFYERVICRAAWALIVAKFDQRNLCILGTAIMESSLDVGSRTSGVRRGDSLIRLAVQKHCSTSCNGNCKNDYDDGFNDLRHGPHSSAAIALTWKDF